MHITGAGEKKRKGRIRFALESVCPATGARSGRLILPEREIRTPVFMPVGTRASVRGTHNEALWGMGYRMLLANTWHLLLRPGPEVFRRLGGLQKFMNWPGHVLTDSGGYQIFSLPGSRTIREEGAEFVSYVDQRKILLSPEKSVGMQLTMGADIMMALDVCVPADTDRQAAAAAVERTTRWAKRSLETARQGGGSIFGIVQGACHEDLRKLSSEQITGMDFDGFAIGGLAVGESLEERQDFTALTVGSLPAEKPRYLMGVGTPLDLLEAVRRGVDMFDCILPSAMAGQGYAFTSLGQTRVSRSVYRLLDEPLDPACGCPTCRQHSLAYLHHLFKAEEYLGAQLLTAHNLTFYADLMRRMREAIDAGSFPTIYREMKPVLQGGDSRYPVHPPKARRRRGGSRFERGDFTIVRRRDKPAVVRQNSSGEVMHPGAGPDFEAMELYVGQAGIPGATINDRLTVWDIGLGAGHNAMAAIRAAAAGGQKLDLHSFERDLDPLRLARHNPGLFPHVRHPGPTELLRNRRWDSADGRIRWFLHEGDFPRTLENIPPADRVFYDPFSPGADPRLWSLGCFREVYLALRERPAWLITYAAGTPVRSAMLAAGFLVAGGRPSGQGHPTTVALTPAAHREGGGRFPLLGSAWLDRWERSHRRLPADVTDAGEFAEKIRCHPQFQSLSPPESNPG